MHFNYYISGESLDEMFGDTYG